MTDQQTAPNAPQPGTAPEQPAGETTGRMMTQAEIDRMISERLARKEQSILKELGVSTLDDAKKATSKLKEIEESQKSEQQKLQDQLTALQKQVETANAARIEATIRASAIAELGKVVPPDRVSAAYKLLDKSGLKVGDGETVDGLSAAIEAMLKENAFLKDVPPSQTTLPKDDKPKIATMNPAKVTEQGANMMDWHPMHRQRNATFSGALIPPPGGESKK